MFQKTVVSLSVLAWCLCGQAEAGSITAPESVLSEPDVFAGFGFDLTIDQSGLTTGYVSGVTDFDSYIAGDPKHEGDFVTPNFAASPDRIGIVDYDMGSSMRMSRLVLWQYPFLDVGPIVDFDVYTSNDPTFAVSTLVGSFTALEDGVALSTSAQVFDLTDSTARYLRIDVRSSRSDPSEAFGWSEIAVDVVPDPAPFECSALSAVKVVPANPIPSGFGARSAIFGDRLLIGIANVPKAIVFLKVGDDWIEEARLEPNDGGAAGGRIPAALTDTQAFLGAVLDSETAARAGAVYIHERTGTNWTQVAKLFPNDPALDDRFGASLAVSGNTLVVGARLEGTKGFNAGAVYVFELVNGTWTQTAKLVASDGIARDNFGVSVAIDGDTIVVGAWHLIRGGPGAAYVFVRDGPDWVEQAKLTADDAQNNDRFGREVAVSGDQAAAIAIKDDFNGIVDAGSAYVYERVGTTWSQIAHFAPNDVAAGDRVGENLVMVDNLLLLGSEHHGSDGTNSGGAWLFERGPLGWSQKCKVISPEPGPGISFGRWGTMDATRVVANAVGIRASFVYTLEVNQPPSCSPGDSTFDLAVGKTLTIPINGTDPNAGDTIELTVTGLPSSATMTPALPQSGNPVSSTLSWAPTIADVGIHEITFTLTDNSGLTTTCTLTIDVEFDRDGDGLLDVWELDGYTAPNGVFVDLPAMGANVDHKDVFVSIKFMQNAEFDHKPADLAPIVQAFANAPIDNPDGITGIALHLLVSGTPVPFVENLGTGTTGASYQWARTDGEPETFFDDIKAAAFPEELAQAIRLCLFAHQISNLTDSGIARGIPTSDFIVSLGAFVDLSKPTPRTPPVDLQRGTFMHEAGHGFGLRHGGADQTNFKPNYLSVMNYSFQAGLKKNGSPVFDYSRQALPDLSETALNEELGIENWPASVAGFQTTWFKGFGVGATQEWTSPFVPGVEHNVDWDQDGTDDEISASASINKDFSKGLFASQDDWNAIVFGGGVIGGGVAESLPDTTELEGELDVATAMAFVPPPVEGLAARSGRGSVRLNWNPAGFRGDVTYSIFRKIAGAAGAPALLATTTSSLYSDRTVVRRTTYEYTVTFVDALGAESAASDPVTVRVR